MQPESVETLKLGRIAALENASSLVEEAELLHKHQHWARTIFLCQIAGEELGKFVILTTAAVELTVSAEGFDWKKLGAHLRSHREKLTVISVHESVFWEPPPDHFPTYFAELKKTIEILENGKQHAIYSDIQDGNYYSPTWIYNEGIATNALNWAKGRLRLINELNSLQGIETMTPESIVAAWERIGIPTPPVYGSKNLRTTPKPPAGPA